MPSALPEQLLLSDLLRRRVRCDQGLDHGPGSIAWMHPPVHRLLGWASRPSAFGQRREVWRLDQLKGMSEAETFVRGEPAVTDPDTLRRLPTLFEAVLLGADGQPLGCIADAAVELRTGRVRHYLVSRSDPRLPGSSRWRLVPDRIVDQQPGRVFSALRDLDDLPLARASVRQEFLRRSRRWRDQMGEETARLRDQFQQAGGRLEDRLEGWLEEPPWDERQERAGRVDEPAWPEGPAPDVDPDAYDDWIDENGDADGAGAPDAGLDSRTPAPGRRPPDRYRGRDDDDPWV
ncbi:RNA methyltransferase [Cyanobium sp. FGCU-6]|nr:RNA methyltransferase [Cyanobium sp. FGCU6]